MDDNHLILGLAAVVVIAGLVGGLIALAILRDNEVVLETMPQGVAHLLPAPFVPVGGSL